MIQTIIGRKIDQAQKFLENGKRVPVTLIHVADNAVLQVKTQDKDTYTAVQLGFATKKKPTKPALGHAKKAGFDTASSFIREVRLNDEEAPAVGDYVTVDALFKPGDVVTVSGTSKGKGFAGVVKRHGFRGGPKTHGQSDRHRAPGSIGQTTTPGRVYKGKRMAGRMGSDKVTVANLTIISVDLKSKVLMVSGLVPGHKQSIVTITKTGERKKFIELLGEKAKREAAEALEAERAAKLAESSSEDKEEAKKAEAQAASSSAKASEDKEEVKAEAAAEIVETAAETGETPAEEKKEEKK